MRKPRIFTWVSRRPRKVELSIGAPAHPVAGAVEPLAGGERVGHEALGGEAGAGKIAARQAGAADEQLAATPIGTGFARSSST